MLAQLLRLSAHSRPNLLIGYTAIDLLVRLVRGDAEVPISVELDMPLIRQSVIPPTPTI